MSVEIEDIKKMINTCQAILESCERSFVWEDEDSYPYGDFRKPFNLSFPHPQIYTELQNLLETFSGSSLVYDQVISTCTLDEEWAEYGTYGLDRDFSRYLIKFTLKPEYAEQVKTYFNHRLIELQKGKKEIG